MMNKPTPSNANTQSDDVELQRKYYDRTSARFDQWHLGNAGDVEHVVACDLILGYLTVRDPSASLLDIGGGTGRFYRYVRDNHPNSKLQLMAIEPSAAQRDTAYAAGVPREQHIEGDATNIAFGDDTFDYTTEFGVVHHIKDARKAVSEMCRVARKGVFLSDCNRYGQGSLPTRIVKQILRQTGTLPLVDRMRTGGNGYYMSETDGLYFPFSVFDVLDVVRGKFPKIHYWATLPSSSSNLMLGAPQVLVFATK